MLNSQKYTLLENLLQQKPNKVTCWLDSKMGKASLKPTPALVASVYIESFVFFLNLDLVVNCIEVIF